MNAKYLGVATVGSGLATLAIVWGIYAHNQRVHDAYVHSRHSFQYLAAAKDIAGGNRIDANDLIAVNWTSDQPVHGAFELNEKDKVVGRIVAYPVSDGMIITDRYLAGPDSALGLPHKIPPGMRAIAIKTDEVNDLGGLLYPGLRVDILAAIKDDGGKVKSEAIVQNVLVLSTGKQINPDPSGKPATVPVVTVLVSLDQARRIAVAEQEGTLYFALRNGSDNQVEEAGLQELSKPALPPGRRSRQNLAAVPPFSSEGVVVQTTMGDKTIAQLFRNNLPVADSSETMTPGGPK
ncbi:Flp pilus assembly protein CpaB [Pseudacidobacterium ailaaui]|uniref:Flp pilus assembly protein CpaB n=1 Tax=Pseudacidobacterium ailaaui TaxID=1382359 RepID=UPI00047C8C1F|nr:Flp pilus assembly protein CpaB [Pseudacidobacterium ailaaui]